MLLKICLLVMASVMLMTLSKAARLPPKPRQSGLELLGTIDGTSFYVEHEPKRTWTEAREMCQNNSMDLAILSSWEQTEFLLSVNETTYLEGNYWTAAKDFMFAKAFHWANDDSGQPELGSFPGGWYRNYPPTPPHYCGCLWVMWNENAGMETELCSQEFASLCYTTDTKSKIHSEEIAHKIT